MRLREPMKRTAWNRLCDLYEVSDPAGRILPMEGMRGLAVGLVYFVHFFDFFHGYITPDSMLHLPFYFLATIGNLGVDLFFVISDYLIYGILLRQDQTYLKFWKRRIVRIYPVFLVAMATYMVCSLALPAFDKIGHPEIGVGWWLLLNLLLLPGILPVRPLIMVAWSLSYEFFYYLFSPLVVGGLRLWAWTQSRRVIFVACVYLAGFGVLLAFPDERGRLLMFLAGAFLLEAKRAGLLEKEPSVAGQVGAVVFLALAFYTYFGLTSNAMLWDGPRLLQRDGSIFPVTVPLFSVAFFWLGFQSFRPGGALAWILSLRPMRYLGNMSYTVYLFHVLALEGVRYVAVRVAPPSGNQPGLFLLWFAVGWLAVWVVSTAVFLLVEKPVSLRKSGVPRAARSS
jgi:exopolysaccharide production protein ExoZ